ncbi:MBL fold metallo-hydrolase [Lacrimispora sp. 210928-DFI.3.58]|uniref:MBL fold metallo-hydrolase n=1 Tax=Lacrimispora sp. 210928-DFI.3.58 TaxID=2883214 RepID=UPI001D06F7C6|nr:MBL fold metallo-hydrolase [Lacrimispora sp. 210928-DFI.3.58]MCB7318201.1 MBL fold metallo-hydrolase [Lacrimispora sp. 210928-DFI.3.58]
MKLNFLGKGSAFYPVYGNTGAYFLYGKELYLIDCGETAFDHLYHLVDLDEIEKVYVILTHLHADHVGSLGTLISYFYCLRQMQVHVVHPEHTIVELLTLEGIDKKGYVYTERLPENGAGLTAEPVEVKHAADMKCYGYILSDGEDCIYYSGDSSALPEQVLAGFLEGKIGRIYHDTSTHDSPNPSHCFYGRLEQWIPAKERSRVFCMHLDSPCEELLKEKGFQIVEVVK